MMAISKNTKSLPNIRKNNRNFEFNTGAGNNNNNNDDTITEAKASKAKWIPMKSRLKMLKRELEVIKTNTIMKEEMKSMMDRKIPNENALSRAKTEEKYKGGKVCIYIVDTNCRYKM